MNCQNRCLHIGGGYVFQFGQFQGVLPVFKRGIDRSQGALAARINRQDFLFAIACLATAGGGCNAVECGRIGGSNFPRYKFSCICANSYAFSRICQAEIREGICLVLLDSKGDFGGDFFTR